MQRIAIWGTGKVAERFYFMYKDKFEVECFYDNYKVGEKFGICIKKYDKDSNLKIIIASSFWKEIAQQIKETGKKYLVDYIDSYSYETGILYRDLFELNGKEQVDRYTNWDGRKYAVISGNCQTLVYEDLLSLNKKFNSDYIIIKTPKVYQWYDDPEYAKWYIINSNFWRNIDLYIYQNVKLDNRINKLIYSENILKQLEDDCIKVCIENIYFDGYWPQIGRVEFVSWHGNNVALYKDKFFDDLENRGETLEVASEKMADEKFITPNSIYKCVDDSFSNLESRERLCDIRLIEYLKENYRRKQLFYSPNHPIEEVMIEYTNRIWEYLGYDREDISLADYSISTITLKGQDVPIYESVIKYLGLENYEKYYYIEKSCLKNIRISREEYAEWYFKIFKNN